MEYQLYENSDILLNDSSGSSKNSWSMESQGDFFVWNGLKIDQGSDVKVLKVTKRKMSEGEDTRCHQRAAPEKKQKDSLSFEAKQACHDEDKGADFQKGVSTAKMPHWQVDDYEEIHTDIESSLTLGGDLVNHNYNVSEAAILSINGITMFKQEAPSPTNDLHRQHRQSPTSSTQPIKNNNNNNNDNLNNAVMVPQSTTDNDSNSQAMLNNTISQLLSPSALASLHNVIDCNNLSPAAAPQDNYVVSSTNYSLIEDCRFQYVLAAATSIATKQNEDTLTYLNQGQSYEIKLKKLGDLSLYKGKLLKSVVRICFHERRLQYMEKEQMSSWQKARPGDRILEVDVPLSYGAYDIYQPQGALNLIHFNWDPTKEVGVYIKVNCISTEFTPKKHGGEKGVPFRIQVETYQTNGDGPRGLKRLHAAACQIKVFKLKGADRKHKQDREKIMKRPLSEQEKYQPSYECTVLNDISNDAILAPPPLSPTGESSMDSNPQLQSALAVRNESTFAPADQVQDVQKIIPETYTDKKLVTSTNDAQLTQHSSPEETTHWLVKNRFNNYLAMFEKFSGDDLLRMTREDLIQICGNADGIRLHNALHSKTIAPKLKLYVCQEGSTVYSAIFLTSHSTAELLQKLCLLVGVSQHQVVDVYLEGPHAIHVQLSDDLLRHIKEETMFRLEVIQQAAGGGGFVFLLKGVVK